MLDVLATIVDGLRNAALMAYEVWWALVLGFLVSAMVQAWVPRQRIEASMAGRGPRPGAPATAPRAPPSSGPFPPDPLAESLFSEGGAGAGAAPVPVAPP